MKALNGLRAVAVAVLVAGSAVGVAEGATEASGLTLTQRCRPRVCIGGGGIDVPTPFENTNRKAELSDGEDYTLEGYVMMFDPEWDSGTRSMDRARPFLRVDLARHPWLASAKRKAFPYYMLEGNPSFWRDLELRSVRIVVRATSHILQTRRGPEHQLTLRPIGDITVLTP